MKRVLFVNPFGIGDVLFSLVAVESLRRARPELEIGFVCNERTEALVRMDPSIDRTFVFHRDLFRRLWSRSPLLFLRKLRRLLAEVRGFGYDTMIDLSLGREYAFFGKCIGIRERVGYDRKGRGLFLTKRTRFEAFEGRPVAEAHLDLVASLGVPVQRGRGRLPLAVPAEEEGEIARRLRRSGAQDGDLVLALAPGGGRSWGADARYKQWDAERFGQAAASAARGRRVRTLVLGDRAERALCERAASVAPGALVLCGEPIARVAAALRASRALVANDGGLLHLANALGVPTVGVYGPVDERAYGPYGSDVPHRTVTEPVPCRPCYASFRFPPCPHDRRCLDLLPAAKVAAALEEIV